MLNDHSIGKLRLKIGYYKGPLVLAQFWSQISYQQTPKCKVLRCMFVFQCQELFSKVATLEENLWFKDLKFSTFVSDLPQSPMDCKTIVTIADDSPTRLNWQINYIATFSCHETATRPFPSNTINLRSRTSWKLTSSCSIQLDIWWTTWNSRLKQSRFITNVWSFPFLFPVVFFFRSNSSRLRRWCFKNWSVEFVSFCLTVIIYTVLLTSSLWVLAQKYPTLEINDQKSNCILSFFKLDFQLGFPLSWCDMNY